MLLKKSLGQHFLNDKNILAKQANLLNPKGKVVLEIGSGDGRLTEQLFLAGAKKIIAIEKDKKLCNLLKTKFKKNIKIINEDFLKIKPFKVEKIIGNVPYYISSPILFRLKEFDFKNGVLMLQDEFVKKMFAKPGSKNYGRLTLTSNLFYNIKYIQKVNACSFIPKPKVNSAIILITKKNRKIGKNTESIINTLFQHKNKKIKNAFLDGGFEYEKIKVLEEFLNKRPKELELKTILKICKKLEKIKN